MPHLLEERCAALLFLIRFIVLYFGLGCQNVVLYNELSPLHGFFGAQSLQSNPIITNVSTEY